MPSGSMAIFTDGINGRVLASDDVFPPFIVIAEMKIPIIGYCCGCHSPVLLRQNNYKNALDFVRRQCRCIILALPAICSTHLVIFSGKPHKTVNGKV